MKWVTLLLLLAVVALTFCVAYDGHLEVWVVICQVYFPGCAIIAALLIWGEEP